MSAIENTISRAGFRLRFLGRTKATAIGGRGVTFKDAPAPVPQPERNLSLGPSAPLKTEILTAPGGALGDIEDALRRNVAVLSDGTFYIHSAVISDPQARSLTDRARRLGINLKEPEPVELSVIRELYGTAATKRIDNAEGIKARFVAMIEEAVAFRTSDIQVKLNEEQGSAEVRFQIDGFLSGVVEEFHHDELEALITTAFYYGDNGDATPNPSKNQKVTVNKRHKLPPGVFSLRLHFAKLASGRHLNIRVIYEKLAVSGQGLSALGLPREIERTLLYVQTLGKGLLTIGAPTEHGKSTTLTVWLGDLLDSRGGKLTVASVDDPPEGLDPRIIYFPVSDGGGDEVDSFTEALKASLRIAPHVVRVGECREGPPARMAFDAANTGKLVSTTIHCAGVLNIPSRYEELGVPTLLAYSAERHACWYSQRLVPKLCPGCRRLLSEAAKKDARLDVLRERFEGALGQAAGDLYARGPGCDNCLKRSAKIGIAGIKGRQLIGETLIPDQRICDLLRNRQHEDARRTWLVDTGGRSMALVGYPYLLRGDIGVQEWVSYVASAEDLKCDLALAAQTGPRP
ncbi:MAG: type secretion system protein [Rhodospirillales bacterium]|nr:type secretion system protein [Rhodospirillales bacterium]